MSVSKKDAVIAEKVRAVHARNDSKYTKTRETNDQRNHTKLLRQNEEIGNIHYCWSEPRRDERR